jgi:speckle-type POZ protein
LSEYSLELVEMMVDYFYLGHYDNPTATGSRISLSMHSSMLALADKNDIEGLQKRAGDLYIHGLKHKDVELEDFLKSLPVLYQLPILVSVDAIDEAIAHTRENLLTCTCREVTKVLIDQLSDACQDFLKDVMMSVMSTPLKEKCEDCKERARSLQAFQGIQGLIPNCGSYYL